MTKRTKANPHFVDNYESVRAEAQRQANKLGFDFGIEKDFFGFRCFMLPAPKNRYGHELQCEVVMPENYASRRY